MDYDAELHPVNTVRVHTADGARRAVEHLYQLGHRNIGFVGPRNSYRYPLSVAALAAQRLPLDDEMNCWIDYPPAEPTSHRWREAAVEPFRQWLGRRGPGGSLPATALICTNDAAALGVLSVMREHGFEPGKDLSLVGFDNLEVRGVSPAETPVLTTVDNPTDIIGNRAAELLLNQIVHGQTQIVHERIPAELIVRQSTGPCPANQA
jgi:DNA-binding LacI/PurR family transcriptional regulator